MEYKGHSQKTDSDIYSKIQKKNLKISKDIKKVYPIDTFS